MRACAEFQGAGLACRGERRRWLRIGRARDRSRPALLSCSARCPTARAWLRPSRWNTGPAPPSWASSSGARSGWGLVFTGRWSRTRDAAPAARCWPGSSPTMNRCPADLNLVDLHSPRNMVAWAMSGPQLDPGLPARPARLAAFASRCGPVVHEAGPATCPAPPPDTPAGPPGGRGAEGSHRPARGDRRQGQPGPPVTGPPGNGMLFHRRASVKRARRRWPYRVNAAS